MSHGCAYQQAPLQSKLPLGYDNIFGLVRQLTMEPHARPLLIHCVGHHPQLQFVHKILNAKPAVTTTLS
jgi:hypothetical protein